ncbi:Endonuclease/exonuclease/phosphatase [Leucosporidium creatinivorum]|uniref:Endonuclease/exonuclease/phosphatase n=1 Tax=Leucosporidium creatinivorum TaxID=106004 RepID=A0A1Y2EZN3_9BASI|nr:Endonuclease/exonuclease/phosphatase [Leucosporidium creatinivorum]
MGQGVSAIKQQLSEGKVENYVMRQRMKSFVVDQRFPSAGHWEVFNGFLDAGEGSDMGDRGALKLKLATWNIWFDRQHEPVARWNDLFDQLFAVSADGSAPSDVVALQEIITQSYEQLLSREDVRKDWILTDFTDVLERSSSWYGTLLLVRKEWLRANGLDQVDMSLTRYESPMARTLLTVEVGNADGIALRVGTSHFESAPQDVERRRRQFLTAARLLTFPRMHASIESPSFPRRSVDEFEGFLHSRAAEGGLTPDDLAEVPPSIICGDTNIEGYEELAPLLDGPLGYVDTFASAHPPSADAADLAVRNTELYSTHPTFGTTYTEDPIPVSPKRIDYILAHKGGSSKLRVLSAKTVGGEVCRVRGEDGRMREAVCVGGKEGKMYPSDHLGVVVELEFARKEAATA